MTVHIPSWSIISLCLIYALTLSSCAQDVSREADGDGRSDADHASDSLDTIDDTYPNNWRTHELTRDTLKMQSGHRPCPEEGGEYRYVDPLPVILKMAKDHSVVMINESHFKPLHRVFVGRLASELSHQGYGHFGSELFGIDTANWLNATSGLRQTSYLNRDVLSNPYWTDPIFGQVVERLAASDYKLFSYEGGLSPPAGTQSRFDYREMTQADNILEYLEAIQGDGKLLIHAGYHHVKERDDITDIMWMAEQFKIKSGLDPLTISQTDCYGTTMIEGNLLGYGLLTDLAGTPISRNGYDLILSAPKVEFHNGRPLWLRDELNRRFIDVPEPAKFDGPEDFTVITAYATDRPETAPPEDVIYRHPYSDKVLALRPGRYSLKVTDRDDLVLAEIKLIVK